MSKEVLIYAISAIIYAFAVVGVAYFIFSLIRKIKSKFNRNTQIANQIQQMQNSMQSINNEAVMKLATLERIHDSLKDILHSIRTVDSKIGDLTMRVNIAEVRLEERKPQIFFPQESPQLIERKKPGRKPKELIKG